MALVDTSVWIDFLNGRETWQVSRLNQLILSDTDIYSTGLIIQEVLSGIKKKRERQETRSDLERFIIIQPSIQNHFEAAEIFDSCRRKGLTIRSSIDCLTASLALEYDLLLLHNDRDFRSIAEVFPLRLGAEF